MQTPPDRVWSGGDFSLPQNKTEKILNIAHHKDDQHDEGQQDGVIPAQRGGETHALALIGLGQEVLIPPAVPGRQTAEQQVNHGAKRKQVVSDYEVFQFHNAHAKDLYIRPKVIAQQTGQTQQKNQHQIGQNRLAAGNVPPVHPASQDVFKYRRDGGQGRKEQKHKEQRAPQPSARHLIEHVGQRHKNQTEFGIGADAKGKGGGEDDQAGHKGHAGIQHAHVDGLAEEPAFLADVAAENGHGANAQAQGEKGLSHGGVNRLA